MEDHHVDRPDVEARQRVKLTGTNRSFDLIALVAKARDRDREPVIGDRKTFFFWLPAADGLTENASFASFSDRSTVTGDRKSLSFRSPIAVPRSPIPFFAGLVALAR